MLETEGEKQQQRFLQQQQQQQGASYSAPSAVAHVLGGDGNLKPPALGGLAQGTRRKQAALPADSAGAPEPRSADRHKNKSAERRKVKKDRHLYRGTGCRAHATWSIVQGALDDHAAAKRAADMELQEEQDHAGTSMTVEARVQQTLPTAEYEALEVEPVEPAAAPPAADLMYFPSLPRQQKPPAFGPESYITPSSQRKCSQLYREACGSDFFCCLLYKPLHR